MTKDDRVEFMIHLYPTPQLIWINLNSSMGWSTDRHCSTSAPRLGHPLLDVHALKVQRALPQLQGIGNGSIFFCCWAADDEINILFWRQESRNRWEQRPSISCRCCALFLFHWQLGLLFVIFCHSTFSHRISGRVGQYRHTQTHNELHKSFAHGSFRALITLKWNSLQQQHNDARRWRLPLHILQFYNNISLIDCKNIKLAHIDGMERWKSGKMKSTS